MTTRYDLSVRRDAAKRVLALLRRVERLAGWHVRRDRGQRVRAKRARRGDTQGMARPLATLASWNIHGLKSKREDVEYFLRKRRVEILALQ